MCKNRAELNSLAPKVIFVTSHHHKQCCVTKHLSTRWLQATTIYCCSWVCRLVGWCLWSGCVLCCASGQPWWARGPCWPWLGSLTSVSWSGMTLVLHVPHLPLASHIFLAKRPRPVPLEEAEEWKTEWKSPSFSFFCQSKSHCFDQNESQSLPRFRRWGNRPQLFLMGGAHESTAKGTYCQSTYHSRPEKSS